MKGIVWLMQEKGWFFNLSTHQMATIWWSLDKDWARWHGCQSERTSAGRVLSERPPEERETCPKGVPISKTKGSHVEWRGARELAKKNWEWKDSRKTSLRGEKQSCLKAQQGEDRFLISIYFTSPSKKPRDAGRHVHVLGSWDSLRRLLGEAVTSCPQVLFNAQS